MVDFRQLDALITAFEDTNIQIATLGIRDVDMEAILNPNRIKVVVNNENKALYFSRSPIPNFANSKENPLTQYPYLRHIGLYAYRADTLKKIIQLAPTALEQIESLEQLRWLYYGFAIKVVETNIETPNIDVPEDVAKVLDFIVDFF